MADDCSNIERESARAGDRYYSVMTEWLTRHRNSIHLRDTASILARAYGRSLGLLLRCLERMRPTEKTEKKIGLARDLKMQVEKEAEFLQSPVGSLTTAPDET